MAPGVNLFIPVWCMQSLPGMVIALFIPRSAALVTLRTTNGGQNILGRLAKDLGSTLYVIQALEEREAHRKLIACLVVRR